MTIGIETVLRPLPALIFGLLFLTGRFWLRPNQKWSSRLRLAALSIAVLTVATDYQPLSPIPVVLAIPFVYFVALKSKSGAKRVDRRGNELKAGEIAVPQRLEVLDFRGEQNLTAMGRWAMLPGSFIGLCSFVWTHPTVEPDATRLVSLAAALLVAVIGGALAGYAFGYFLPYLRGGDPVAKGLLLGGSVAMAIAPLEAFASGSWWVLLQGFLNHVLFFGTVGVFMVVLTIARGTMTFDDYVSYLKRSRMLTVGTSVALLASAFAKAAGEEVARGMLRFLGSLLHV